MPRYIEAPELTPNEALFVLESALAEKKITKDDIRRYRYELSQEIQKLESRIGQLRGAELAAAGNDSIRPASLARVQKVQRERKGTAGKAKRKLRVTPERLASMRVQGRFLGLLHKFQQKDRAKYLQLARKDGRESAISAMEKALGV